MYYFFDYDDHFTTAEFATETAKEADQLRHGLDVLRRYIDSSEPSALVEAIRILSSLDLVEARLYFGVALDLDERHNEAGQLFHRLAEDVGVDSALRHQARYNEAVAKFRKYAPEELEAAIDLLDELLHTVAATALPSVETLRGSPLAALAMAAKANVLAHMPMFWKQLILKLDRGDEVTSNLRRQAHQELNHWSEQVSDLTQRLDELLQSLDEGPAGTWDDQTRRQLRWMVENARGNLALNKARYVLSELEEEPALQAKLRLLEQARNHFQKCADLLPLNTETLTNLATVELDLGETVDRSAEALQHLDQAREACDRAIAINPRYEYAYYRKVLAWLAETERHRFGGTAEEIGMSEEAARAVLGELPNKPPKIPGLKRLADELLA